jgi:hypothetical protein
MGRAASAKLVLAGVLGTCASFLADARPTHKLRKD